MLKPAGRRPVVVGHRGAAALAPENTASALRAGIDAGADAVEIDVGLAADGRVVVLHDATLDRTTDGEGPLSAWRWSELSRLDAGSWHSARFRGEPLLDLDRALALVRGRVPIVVEIKARSERRARALHPADRRLLDEVIAALERTGGLEDATLSSFHWPVLAEAASRAPGLDLALTVGLTHPSEPVAAAREIGAWTLHPNRRLCSRGFVGRAQAAGLAVLPYVVNRARELDPLLAVGVDGVISDDPATLVRVVSRLWPDPPPRPPFTLGIDQGSAGTRAVLLSSDDQIVSTRSVAVPSRGEPGGAIVQDAEAIAASVVRVAVPLLESAPGPVSGAGIAAQRSSLAIWRRADGRALEPVRSWRSTWRPPALEPLLDWEASIRRITGLTSRYPYSGIRLAERAAAADPIGEGLRAGRLAAGPVASFLAARLAGCRDGAADPSLAQRTLLFDIRRLRWEDSLGVITGAPLAALPTVLPTTADRGRIRLGGFRPSLRAVVGDAGAAFRAVAGPSGFGGVLVLGTGGFLLIGTGRRPVEVPGLLTTLLWEAPDGPRYAVEGTVHGLATSLREAGDRAQLSHLPFDLLAAHGGPARSEPWVLPAIEGLGTPDWDPRPRFEVEEGTWRPDELVRGTLAGIAERFGRIGDLLRSADLLPDRLVSTGGLAMVPHLVSAIADRLDTRITVDSRPHRTAAGAAILAR